jgi:hypothetical protein
LFCDVPCIVCVYMCTEQLPPGGYPIAVKYIISYHIISYHIPLFSTDPVMFLTVVACVYSEEANVYLYIIYTHFGLKRLVTVLLLRRPRFDPGQGLCDTCAGESGAGTGRSFSAY